MAIKLRGRPLPRWGYHSGECRGEAGTGAIMRGEAGVLYFVFSPQSCGVFPVFFGDRFSVPHGDSVRHPFGIRGRAEPAGACAPPTGGEGTILSHNLLNYVNFTESSCEILPPNARHMRDPLQPSVTRQTVLCTTPFSFGMRKLEKSILWHTVCINRKRGVCSRRSVYAASPRSG